MPSTAARLFASVAALLIAAVLATDNFVAVPTTGLEPGWKFVGYRYNWRNFAEIPGTRQRGVVDSTQFSAGYGRFPAVYGFGWARDLIMLEWTGSIRITLAGTYRFRLGSDDGSLLYIDGRVVSAIAMHSTPSFATVRA